MAVDSTAPKTLAAQLGNSHVGVRNDLEISRHVFFGETSYVIRDPVSFEGHNFSPADYEIFTHLRDELSLNEVFQELCTQDFLAEEQEEAFYAFVIELQKRGLLNLPVTDGESLYQQYEQRERRRSQNWMMKLLFLKVPLGCPDRFLKSTYHLARPFFSKMFFVAWLIGLFAACGIVIAKWDAFTSDLTSLLAFQNLPAMLLVMSGLKLWHEMGHGYACRHYGVSVPSAGLLFMLGTPLAFVDATGSWSLSKRWQRQVINLAGIYFEMMFTIVAAFVWAFTTQATIQSLAHFTLLISSVTTIGFNFNPLMKYDGYYVLADALGIPNLRSRASFATQTLCKRVFFGIKYPNSDSRWLRIILVSYGLAAAVYKLVLVVGIAAMIALQIWVIGLLVGGYYMVSSLGAMLWKAIRFLMWAEEIEKQRTLAYSYLALLLLGIPGLLLACPVPGRSHARGVVENASIAVVHVEEGGFLTKLCVVTGQTVGQGDLIGQVENIRNVASLHRKQAELQQLEMQYRSQQLEDRLQARQTSQEISRLQYELDLERSALQVELIESPGSGEVIACGHERKRGQYLAPGEELLRIGKDGWLIRAVADSQSLADIKPQAGQTAHCRFYSDPSHVYEGTIEEISRVGSRVVAHEALTHLAGGFIPVDPETMEATEPFFELMIKLNVEEPPMFLRNGAICEIRFQREYEPLGHWLYRSFLRFANQIYSK